MYRIELSPGEETALRTIEEMAIGIRNGVITPRARIWHNAGQKWLPIEFHPHYRAAMDQLSAMPSAEESSALREEPGPVASEAVELPAAETSRPARGGQKSVRRPLGLAAIGLVLVAGAQMALSVTPFGWLSATATATQVSALAATAFSSDSMREPAANAAVENPAPAAAPAPKTIAGGAVVLGPVQRTKPAIVQPAVEKILPAAPVLPTSAENLSSDAGEDSLQNPPTPDTNETTTAETAGSPRP